MLLFGIIFTSILILVIAFKIYVVWDIARDPFNGGGAPTLDLVFFYPGFLAFGITTILGAEGVSPFPFFGWVLYIALALVCWCIHEFLFRRGEPFREAALTALRKHSDSNAQEDKRRDAGL